jgi:hypothetical protein
VARFTDGPKAQEETVNDPRAIESAKPRDVAEALKMIHDGMEGWVHDIQELSILEDKVDRTHRGDWQTGVAEFYLFVEGLLLGGSSGESYESEVAMTLDRIGENLYGQPSILADGTVSGSGAEDPNTELWRAAEEKELTVQIEEGGFFDESSGQEMIEFIKPWAGSRAVVKIIIPHQSEFDS